MRIRFNVRLIRNYQIVTNRCYCNYLPKSQTVTIKVKDEQTVEVDNLKDCEPAENNKEFRVNDVRIQMISRNIYEQLFKNSEKPLDPKIIQSCQLHLLHHGIDYKECARLPDVELNLPKLEGENIVEHFWKIGEAQCAPYRDLLVKLAKAKIPPIPKHWHKAAGWHRYVGNKKPEPVGFPPDDALIFDVEVLMSAGKRPTMACALSPEAWYGFQLL